MDELETCINQLNGMLQAGAVTPQKAPLAWLMAKIILLQNEKIKQLESSNECSISGPAT